MLTVTTQTQEDVSKADEILDQREYELLVELEAIRTIRRLIHDTFPPLPCS